jgi:transcriptional accessory protein Tex/SPT6
MDGVETLNDLERGMVLEGAVTNVAAFGAFVDIGVHQDGLVHVSAMSKTFVKDPREVVKPGDIVRVKVLEVDVARKRIALTLRLDDEVGPRADRDGSAAPRIDRASRGPSRSAAPSRREEGAVRSPKRCAAPPWWRNGSSEKGSGGRVCDARRIPRAQAAFAVRDAPFIACK